MSELNSFQDKSNGSSDQAHVSNSIWADIKQGCWNDIVAPAYNTALRAPINTAVHWAYAARGLGKGHEQILSEADTSGAGLVGKTVQSISSGVAGVVELAITAKLGSEFLGAAGNLVEEDAAVTG